MWGFLSLELRKINTVNKASHQRSVAPALRRMLSSHRKEKAESNCAWMNGSDER